MLAFLGMPGHLEWLVILVIGLLLFGKRLPEVGRSIGRAIVEFKKGVKGIEDEVEQNTRDLPKGDSASALPPTADARRVSTSQRVEEGV